MGQQLPTKCKTEVPLEHWQHVARPSWNMLCFFCSEYRTLSSHYLFVIGIKRGWSFTMKQKDGYCTSKCWRYTAGKLGWHANITAHTYKRTCCIWRGSAAPRNTLDRLSIQGHVRCLIDDEIWFGDIWILNRISLCGQFLLVCFRIGDILYVLWKKKSLRKKHSGNFRNGLQTICKLQRIPY